METKVIDGKFLEGKHGHELFQISQKLVLYDAMKETFLLVKIAERESFFAKKYGIWDFPGGRVDISESLEEALRREVVEEIGDGVEYDSVRQVEVFLAEFFEKRVMSVGYCALFRSGEITLSSEHDECRWVTAEDVLKNDEFGPIVKQFIASASERLKEREYLNDAKRIYADFENYRRRQEGRMKELSAIGAEQFALDIIPVIDNFRAASLHVPEGEKSGAWMTGITYIGKQLEEALATNGVSKFEAKEGEMFDPYLHEAVSHEEGAEEGKIVKVLQAGYKSGTKVIRPAKVVVA